MRAGNPLPAREGWTLRLSVTERCNFRCRYCLPERGIASGADRNPLALPELAALVRWLAGTLGPLRVKLTGGEALLRRGIAGMVADIAATPGVGEVSLTTNGALLAGLARPLREAGLARVNVSLDSLDQARFADLSRGGRLSATLAGIDAAREAGLAPLKLNTVLRRSTWKEEVPRLLDYAAERNILPRFIELMAMGSEQEWCEAEFVPATEVLAALGGDAGLLAGASAAPSRLTTLSWRGRPLTVGWIAPRSHPFCGTCRRLRLDAGGRLHRCLMDEKALALAPLLQDANGVDAAALLWSYLGNKRMPLAPKGSATAMNRIGG